MTRTLEAWCKARGHQGGHIFMMIEDLEHLERNNLVDRNSDPYNWGKRDADDHGHGSNIAEYPVPVNSWDDRESTIEYLCGLNSQLTAIWNATEIGPDNDTPVDARF